MYNSADGDLYLHHCWTVTGKTYMLAILAIEYFKFDLIFWVIDFVLSNKASSSQGVSADDLSQHHYLPMIEHFNCHVLFYGEFCGHCVINDLY